MVKPDNIRVLLYGYNSTQSDYWLFSCDRALLARCPRHIQSVFNLILDILISFFIKSAEEGRLAETSALGKQAFQ